MNSIELLKTDLLTWSGAHEGKFKLAFDKGLSTVTSGRLNYEQYLEKLVFYKGAEALKALEEAMSPATRAALIADGHIKVKPTSQQEVLSTAQNISKNIATFSKCFISSHSKIASLINELKAKGEQFSTEKHANGAKYLLMNQIHINTDTKEKKLESCKKWSAEKLKNLVCGIWNVEMDIKNESKSHSECICFSDKQKATSFCLGETFDEVSN